MVSPNRRSESLEITQIHSDSLRISGITTLKFDSSANAITMLWVKI